jgi:flagellar biosynthesis protein FliQ
MAAEKPPHTTPHTQAHTTPPKPPATLGQMMQENLRNGVMVILTFIFVAVYIGALLGLIPGTAKQDPQTLSRIETILFVIIGYYFGRLPVAATEKTLKDQIQHQTGKAETAEQAKTEALQEKQGLQEKLKNTRATLTTAIPEAAPDGLPLTLGRGAATSDAGDALRHSVAAAIRVLDS